MNDPLRFGSEIEVGREIGEQLRHWLGSREMNSLAAQGLLNLLIDASGLSRRLRAPLQNLARKSLFLLFLRQQ